MSIQRPSIGWKLNRKPTTPGEMLLHEFMEPLNLSQHALSQKLRVPATRVGEIIHGQRAVTPETAVRLGLAFGTSPQFWLNLQQNCDLYEVAKGSDKIAREVQRIVPSETEGVLV